MMERDAENHSSVHPYTALAGIYDDVMQHVDYRAWAIYLAEIVERFCPTARTMLELGCGTGTLATELAKIFDWKYRGFDRSPEMIASAVTKTASNENLHFYVDDFTTFECTEPSDIVALLYDGLNYLTDEEDVAGLFRKVRNCMIENSIFIFDASTPANSIKNEEYFEDYGKGDDFVYYRTSEFDADTRLHKTVFELDLPDGVYEEVHIQRAYAQDEIIELASDAGLTIVAAMEDFTWKNASKDSERIHFVMRQ